MKYHFLPPRIAAPLIMAIATLFLFFPSSPTLASDQQRWTGHIDNQLYLDRYFGRSSEPVSYYVGGSSTGYRHRPGYGGVTTIVVERSPHRPAYGVSYRTGSSSFIYVDGYRPNYHRPHKRVHVQPRYYYKRGYPKYKKHYYYKYDKRHYGKPYYGKPYYGKPYYGKPHYGKPHYKKHYRPGYVAPKYPGYKSRHYQNPNRYRIQVPRKRGY